MVSTYIYTNTLVVLEMTRPALKQYIERSAAYFDHDENGSVCISGEFLRPKVQHYNYDFFSGIDYTIDVRKPVGQRVTSIVFEGHELGEDEPVTVCINSYRFCGTGGYDMLPRQKVARRGAHRRGRRDDRLYHHPPRYPCGYPSVLHRDRLILPKHASFLLLRWNHPNGCKTTR